MRAACCPHTQSHSQAYAGNQLANSESDRQLQRWSPGQPESLRRPLYKQCSYCNCETAGVCLHSSLGPCITLRFQDFPNAHFNMHPAKEQKRRATWCEKRGGNTVQYEFNLFSKYDHCTNSSSCTGSARITNHASAPIRKANAAKVGCAAAPAAAPQQTKKEKLWEKEISFWPALDDSYTGRPGKVDYFERRATRSER
ncbi:hypothetical protein HDV62DRAFT_374257 [Trichoderma sp. SZMC 28011]